MFGASNFVFRIFKSMSPQNSQQHFTSAHHDPSLVILEGFHAIKHALRFAADIELIVASEQSDFETLATTHAPDILNPLLAQTQKVSDTHFKLLTPTPPETGIIAIAKKKHYTLDEILEPSAPIVLLDNPSHPGNVGAVIRVCAAAGVGGVLIRGTIDPWARAVVRGGAGLQFAVPVLQTNESDTETLTSSDRTLIALDERGEPFSSRFNPDEKKVLYIFGSERHGISSELLDRCDQKIAIPMKDGVSSLNLATSVAIVVYK